MAQFSEIDLFRGILDNLNIAIYVVDREGKILYWNDGAERITGYLRQDVLGRLQTDNFLGETDAESNELTGVLAPTSIAMREGK
ncbi:MAG: PAS domain-containing protein, partial [Acidobacteria bacterium]|nr:PAS domain-containing protein [Acidobacteriota bacterium]